MTRRARRRTKTAPLIEVIVDSPRWRAQPQAASIVKKAVRTAARAASTPRAELAIVLTDDSAIRALNRQWRGLDAPTNVLSFPTKAPRRRRSPRPADGHLGDVVIAYQTTAREAKAEDKRFRDHLTHLAIHGFLHLLGYDHETDRDASAMERLEVRILQRLAVPDPYAAPRARH
jgi:probable rRNA maturation factor